MKYRAYNAVKTTNVHDDKVAALDRAGEMLTSSFALADEDGFCLCYLLTTLFSFLRATNLFELSADAIEVSDHFVQAVQLMRN